MTRFSSLAMRQYSIGPRTRKYVKGYRFSSFARKYEKQLLNTGLDSLKTAFIKVVYKTGEFLGNNIADTVTKSNDDKMVKHDENPRNVEGIIIPLEKRDEIQNKLRKVLLKWNTIKYLSH